MTATTGRVGVADLLACLGICLLFAAVTIHDHLHALEAMRTR